jgi:hypothetical protein
VLVVEGAQLILLALLHGDDPLGHGAQEVDPAAVEHAAHHHDTIAIVRVDVLLGDRL